ncbi:MAG: PAS domain-containing protein [Rhodospirillaceae bacterium]|nr:PAS domain-containing protein [Rhodospirillaceae bacterium]
MARPTITPTGVERHFDKDEIIVSKTDTKGVITYGNRVFFRIAGYSEEEMLGQPHNMIRHPDMPQCVFKLLWDPLETGNEIFAYVLNMAKNGDHYWVFAHVTPTLDKGGKIVGYHSSRRVPEPAAIEVIKGLYKALLDEEKKHSSPKEGMAAATQILLNLLEEKGVGYDELIFSL